METDVTLESLIEDGKFMFMHYDSIYDCHKVAKKLTDSFVFLFPIVRPKFLAQSRINYMTEAHHAEFMEIQDAFGMYKGKIVSHKEMERFRYTEVADIMLEKCKEFDMEFQVIEYSSITPPDIDGIEFSKYYIITKKS